MPWWYAVVRAAKLCGVHPEVMAEGELIWVSRILAVAEAESYAEAQMIKRGR